MKIQNPEGFGMQDGKVYMAVLTASLFGVSMPVFADGGSRSDAADYIKDSRLTTLVRTALLTDSFVSGLDIKVASDDGVVYLSGIASEPEKQRARILALAVLGVKDVRNNIQPLQMSTLPRN